MPAPRRLDIGGRMIPPKFSYMEKLWIPIWDTINIATIGTVIALIIAVPVAFAAARNTTPHPLCGRCAVRDRVVQVREFADLGVDAGLHFRPGRIGRHHRHRPPLHRFLRQAFV